MNNSCQFLLPAIRKLTEKRRKVEGKLERRDVTHEYSDCGSQTYAPLTRIGVFLDRNSEQYVVKSRFLSTYQGKRIFFCSCNSLTTPALSGTGAGTKTRIIGDNRCHPPSLFRCSVKGSA